MTVQTRDYISATFDGLKAFLAMVKESIGE